MKQKSILLAFLFWFCLVCFTSANASDIVHVEAMNSNIIVLHFDDGYVRYHKKGETRQNEWIVSEPLDVINSVNLNNYTIKSSDGFYSVSKNPLEITRKSKGTEFSWLCQSYSSNVGCINSKPDHAKEHWIYLQLPEPLENGKTYTISTGNVAGNGSEWEFDFNYEKNRTESVHVNLVGYDPRAPKKYGYVYHWAGESGGIDFSEYKDNNFYLINTSTQEKVFSGNLKFRKNKTNNETYQINDTPEQNFLGADVYECDFSGFNTPGEYILAVEGIGCSFPFKIQKDIYRLPFYTSVRGLYHNRSGIELKEPFTEFTRPAPHNPQITPGFSGKLKYTSSRFIDWNNLDNADSDKKAIEDGILGAIDTWGWYQDAGDWDGYFSHLKIPAMLMLTWEIAPEKFADGELNLPEGKNQIPDIVDEASWLIRFFHRTRHEIMNKGFGTGGVGSRVAPDWFGHASEGTPSYLDKGQWIISGEDPFTTYFYAGLAAHYALVLNKLGVEDPNGIDWKTEAEESFEWARNNTKPNDSNPSKVHNIKLSNFEMYAAATLFRLTGEEKYMNAVIQTGSNLNSNSVIEEDQKWGTYSLITGKENEIEDASFMARIKGAVIATADEKFSSVERRACRYGGNMYMPMLVGQGTTPRVFEIMLGHFLSKDFMPTKTSNYLAAIFTTADYFLGCNPLNMTYVTHLGVRYPERVLHIDSWYSDSGEMIPGITPYGPWRYEGSGATGPWDIRWPAKTIYPEGMDNWPGHERWFNNYTTPVNAEFTVHQNTILSAAVYGYLCDVPDGSFQPNKRPEIGIVTPFQNEEIGGDITISAEVSDPDGIKDIAWVEFYNDWHKIGQSNEEPFQMTWKKAKYGPAKISAKVVDKQGFSAKSEEVEITVLPLNYNVKIVLKDSLSGKFIKDCSVTIHENQLFSDSNGEASFEMVSGLLDIKMEHENYLSKTITQLSIYSDTTLTYILIPIKNEITLYIHNKSNSEVFIGVPVIFNAEEKVTGNSGAVHFQVYKGSYNFSIHKNSFKSEEGVFEIIGDSVIHIYLERTEAELKFVLKDGTVPVNNATVIVNSDTLTSTSLGIARFKDLPVPLQLSYQVYKTGFNDVMGSFSLTNDTTLTILMEAYPVGINVIYSNTDIKIWPNPVNNVLNLEHSEEIKSVSVFTVSGNKKKLQINKIQGTIQCLFSEFVSGIYLLKIEFLNGNSEMFKVIKN